MCELINLFQCFDAVDGWIRHLSFSIPDWTETAKYFHTCEHFPNDDECHQYIGTAVEIILTELVDLKQGILAKDFCTHWGSCTEEEAQLLPVTETGKI